MDSTSHENLSENNSDSEIETSAQRIYGPEDLLEVQSCFLGTLQIMSARELRKQEACMGLGYNLLDAYADLRCRFADEYCDFERRHIKSLIRKRDGIRARVNEFDDEIQDMLDLYVDVHDLMKEEQKNVAKQDAFIAHVEKNVSQYTTAKTNLDKLKEELLTFVPPVTSTSSLSSTDISDDFVMANTVTKPFKPMETEILTHLSRITDGINQLRDHCQLFPDFDKHTDPVLLQTQVVAEHVLREFPARSLQAFVDTLPPEQRD